MADLSKIVDDLSKLTVLEAADLAKMLEEKWGVSAAAAVAVAAAPGAAGGGEDDRELRLLLGRRSGRAASARSGGDSNRRSGRNAPLLFEHLGELGSLENRQAGEFVDDLFKIGHGFSFPGNE